MNKVQHQFMDGDILSQLPRDLAQMTSEFRTYFRDVLEDFVYDLGIVRDYCDLIDKVIVKMKENSDGKDLMPIGASKSKST